MKSTLLLAALALASCDRSRTTRGHGAPDVAAIARSAVPAVVRVVGSGGMAQASGAGFVVRGAQGEEFVVSNHHVVWGATDLSLELSDGRSIPATVIGVDRQVDLAVLRPSARLSVQPLSFGDDATLALGDFLILVGSPAGLLDAISLGVLSARGTVPRGTLAAQRSLDYLFTDAALGPGGSGGPALDSDGNVVGVASATLGASGGFGVLIPSGVAASIVAAIERDGHAEHSSTGMQVVEQQLNGASSLRVRALTKGGPAEQAAIAVDDWILSINGRPATSARDFTRREFMSPPGTAWDLDVRRDGRGMKVTVALGAVPDVASP